MTSRKIIATLTIGLLAITMLSITTVAYAQQIINTNGVNDSDDLKFKKRDALSPQEYDEVKTIAMNDNQIKELIKGKNYQFLGNAFIGSSKDNPIKWDPVLLMLVDDKAVSMHIDMVTKQVLKTDIIDKVELNHDSLTRSYATDKYVGTLTLKGLRILTLNQPVYTGSTGNSAVGFTLNTLMSGSTGNACSSSSMPGTYWAQSGYLFTNTGWALVLADTQTNCVAFTSSSISSGSSTDDIRFTTSANNGAWTSEIFNLSQSTNNIFYWTRTGLTSSTVKINDDNTSVFMENLNTNTTWDNQFTTKTITVNTATAKKTDNTWVNWEADSKFERKCGGSPQANNVITGSGLGSGSSATWSVTTMADNWTACTP